MLGFEQLKRFTQLLLGHSYPCSSTRAVVLPRHASPRYAFLCDSVRWAAHFCTHAASRLADFA